MMNVPFSSTVVVEVQFEILVRKKIAGVGRNASERHDWRPLPKSEQSLLSVESLNYAPQTQISCAGLNMCLQDVSRWLNLLLLYLGETFHSVQQFQRKSLKLTTISNGLPATTCFQNGIVSSLVSQSRKSSFKYF